MSLCRYRILSPGKIDGTDLIDGLAMHQTRSMLSRLVPPQYSTVTVYDRQPQDTHNRDRMLKAP